jgi:hypothetical protein
MPPLTEGLARVQIDSNSRTFKIFNLKNGSHEDTWKCLGDSFADISLRLLTGVSHLDTITRQDASTFISDLLEILRTRPSAARSNWLSHIRNEINYQHRHGTWYPHEKSRQFRPEIYEIFSNWKKSPQIVRTKTQHKLNDFASACTALVSLCRTLTEDMSTRHSENSSFLKTGAMTVLKQAKKL